MNNKEDIDQLLARYFAGEPLSLVQQKELDTWIAAHRQEFEQMRKLMQAPVRTAEEIHFDADKAWAKIEPHLENRTRAMTFERKMTFSFPWQLRYWCCWASVPFICSVHRQKRACIMPMRIEQ